MEVDDKIKFIEYWLRKNSVSKNVEIKGIIKMEKLRNILQMKGLKVHQSGTNLHVFKEEDTTFLGIKTGVKKVNERVYSLGNSLTEMGKGTLKYLRRDFDLTASNGIDNVVFYDDDCFLDEEITNYRRIIYQLSTT